LGGDLAVCLAVGDALYGVGYVDAIADWRGARLAWLGDGIGHDGAIYHIPAGCQSADLHNRTDRVVTVLDYL
jgi:hypothetical protein